MKEPCRPSFEVHVFDDRDGNTCASFLLPDRRTRTPSRRLHPGEAAYLRGLSAFWGLRCTPPEPRDAEIERLRADVRRLDEENAELRRQVREVALLLEHEGVVWLNSNGPNLVDV